MKFAGKYRSAGFVPLNVPWRGAETAQLPRPQPLRPPSVGATGGQATVVPQPRYTGAALVGIATMHKSNGVPVFSNAQAEEIAQMGN